MPRIKVLTFYMSILHRYNDFDQKIAAQRISWYWQTNMVRTYKLGKKTKGNSTSVDVQNSEEEEDDE